MSALIEVPRAEQWIFEKLDGDGTLSGLLSSDGGVFQDLIPDGDHVLPSVVMQVQSSTANVYTDSTRVDSEIRILVKAVDQSASSDRVTSILDRVDALLNGSEGTAGGGLVLGCVQERVVSMTTVENGKRYKHLGAVYRLWVGQEA